MNSTDASSYTAVIFTNQRRAVPGDGYGEMAEAMVTLASQQPGYRGIESTRDTNGFGITVSYWEDDASAVAWKNVTEHQVAQQTGRDRWYEWYTVRVATVTREYAMAAPIFHLALGSDWNAAQAAGAYRVSTRGLTVDDVGFMHCSSRQQLVPVAQRWYSDVDDVVILTIDPDAVNAEIRYEPGVPNGDELFPHIYGELPVAAVRAITAWPRDNGRTEPPV